jgi:glycosyltransferase involved in cell wall biosynthesis
MQVCIVGSSTHFISGISYYTYFLARALGPKTQMSVVLMRKLIPRRLYPGRDRVGTPISELQVSQIVPTFEGVDWYGLPSIVRAVRFLRRQRPEVVVFQWWTGTVLPWYLILQLVARRQGASTVMELHEDLDTAELKIPVLASVVTAGLRRLLRVSAAYVVHSEHDAVRLGQKFDLPADRIWVIPHGPYPMASPAAVAPPSGPVGANPVGAEPGEMVPLRLLFFGTIRPYKGLEVLVDAFDELASADPGCWQLTVVGESWEGWSLPLDKIARSKHADHISLDNRYVADEELPSLFSQADLVVLPYLRASASGPLQLTMTTGLPVVVTAVGGLVEAAGGYSGTTFAEPGDVASLVTAIRTGATKIGGRHLDPHSWDEVTARFESCLEAVVRRPDPPSSPR